MSRTDLTRLLAFANQWRYYQDCYARLTWLCHPFNPDLAYHPDGIRITEKHWRKLKQKLDKLDQDDHT